MAIVARDFSYFDRTFAEGEEFDDTDPVVILMPHLFEQAKSKKAAKPATPDKKERP